MIAPQLAQFLPVGQRRGLDEGFDRVVALVEYPVAPVFGAVVMLDGFLALLLDLGQRGIYRGGIAGAQELAEKLILSLECATLVANSVRQ